MNKIPKNNNPAQSNFQQQPPQQFNKGPAGGPLPSQSQSFQSYGGGGRHNYRERDRGRNNDGGNPFGRRRERSPRRGQYGYDNNNYDQHPNTHVEGERNLPGTPHYREKKPFVDPTIPEGFIKVYSRTIFIGGVPHSMTEHELTQQLRPFAEVQSVILNSERKHAFVKVYSRQEAEAVIASFTNAPHTSGLRARWGVGFGPRDCSDYSTGISTIPIARLTDADKKWMVSAEWGGTGGLPLQSGLFVEEPDIEVGHGVSSKSISRRMPTNASTNGPKSDGNPYGARSPRQNYNQGGYNNNPGNIPINFGGNAPPPFQQSPPPQYGGFQQHTPQQGYAQPNPNMNGGGPPPPNAGGVDQAAMFKQMMSVMQQGNQGGQPMDMASMFESMAQMLKQQQQQPPQ
ncbi:unnamed protein product [Ambrosiozyma monospora]|uniref:Unnamed protein product n=1 Tax=Ambrosiozyma monospora TaxID=43982 RepID=A0ACB5TAF6_AMBMO|nr:unnamed protein product [Ambrosiozyma monospora]